MPPSPDTARGTRRSLLFLACAPGGSDDGVAGSAVVLWLWVQEASWGVACFESVDAQVLAIRRSLERRDRMLTAGEAEAKAREARHAHGVDASHRGGGGQAVASRIDAECSGTLSCATVVTNLCHGDTLKVAADRPRG